jgi:hypothetical protein
MSSLTAAFVSDAVELRANATEDDLQVVIRAAYRQVLRKIILGCGYGYSRNRNVFEQS